MPSSPFDITTATNTLKLDDKRQVESVFSVFNKSGRVIRGRARVVPEKPEAAPWLSLTGPAEQDFAIGGMQPYTVRVAPPAGAAAGSYSFRLDVVGVDNPDEELSQGPNVTFVVPAPPPPVKKGFPIWIPIAAVVVLLLAAVGGYAILSGNQNTLHAGQTATVTASIAAGNATSTADAVRAANATGTAVANSTATEGVNETNTAEANLTATAVGNAATAVALATANAAATAVALTWARYDGTWTRDPGQLAGPSVLKISNSNQTITVDITGDAIDFMASGGLASKGCNPPCSWGKPTAQYSGDPLTVDVPLGTRLVHRFVMNLVAGPKILLQDRAVVDGQAGSPTNYIFSYCRTCGRFNQIEICPLCTAIVRSP